MTLAAIAIALVGAWWYDRLEQRRRRLEYLAFQLSAWWEAR